MGDESGYLVTRDQPTKIATMEAIWDTHEAPAPMTLFALPDEEARTNHAQIDFPWVRPHRHALALDGNPRHQPAGSPGPRTH